MVSQTFPNGQDISGNLVNLTPNGAFTINQAGINYSPVTIPPSGDFFLCDLWKKTSDGTPGYTAQYLKDGGIRLQGRSNGRDVQFSNLGTRYIINTPPDEEFGYAPRTRADDPDKPNHYLTGIVTIALGSNSSPVYVEMSPRNRNFSNGNKSTPIVSTTNRKLVHGFGYGQNKNLFDIVTILQINNFYDTGTDGVAEAYFKIRVSQNALIDVTVLNFRELFGAYQRPPVFMTRNQFDELLSVQHINSELGLPDGSVTDTIGLHDQPINTANVNTGDPVWFNETTTQWELATSLTPTPTGVAKLPDSVVLFGKMDSSDFSTPVTDGNFYYLQSAGSVGLTDPLGVKIGWAKSPSEFLVDIDFTPSTSFTTTFYNTSAFATVSFSHSGGGALGQLPADIQLLFGPALFFFPTFPLITSSTASVVIFEIAFTYVATFSGAISYSGINYDLSFGSQTTVRRRFTTASNAVAGASATTAVDTQTLQYLMPIADYQSLVLGYPQLYIKATANAEVFIQPTPGIGSVFVLGSVLQVSSKMLGYM